MTKSKNTFWVIHCNGRGGDLVVSMITINSVDLSSYPVRAPKLIFFC